MSDQGQHIFISYSRQDGAFIQQLIADLQKAEINVWIDAQRLQVGTLDWQRAIRSAIRGAYALVLVVSPDAFDSRYVQAELDIARMYECPIYPVWAEGKDGQFGEYVPFELIRTQYADARAGRYAQAVVELIGGLKAHIPHSDAPAKVTSFDLNFKPRNPYKGLRAFTSADTGDYFGRETTILELVKAVADESIGRFLAIIGPSGSGKSSVVMAGLLPRLQAGTLPESETWTYLPPILPGQHPLESLAVGLAGALNISVGMVLDDLDRSTRGLHLLGRRLAKGRGGRVVLLVDQFEELFTQTMDEDQRQHFINLLVAAATEPSGQILILMTMRADFYDRPLNYEGLRKLMESRTKTIGQMNLDELKMVIEGPAALTDVQLEFEPGLVGDLLFEIHGQIGALPLLQFTLDQLAERRQERRLTTAAYRDLGGVRGALAKHAETTYQKLPSDEHRTMARALFLRLIEPGETEQDTTRRRAAQSELVTPVQATTDLLQYVAGVFTNARLLTTDDLTGKSVIEVSHEALIRTWERLAEWVKQAREDVRLQQIISRDAHEWIRQGKRGDDLYRGIKLAEADVWAGRNIASVDELAFILAAKEFELANGIDQQYLNAIVESAQTGIIVLDAKTMKPVRYNAQTESLLGQPIDKESVFDAEKYRLYRTGTNVIYPNDELPIQLAMNSSQNAYTDDITIVSDDNTWVDVLFNAAPIVSSEGLVTAIILSIENISNLRGLENALQANLRETIALYEATRVFGDLNEVHEILDAAIVQLNMMEPTDGYIVTMDKNSGELYPVRSTFDIGRFTLPNIIFKPQELVSIEDITTYPSISETDRANLLSQNILAVITSPIRTKNEQLSWLSVAFDERRDISAEAERFLATLSDNIAAALDRALMIERLRNQSQVSNNDQI